MEVRTLHPREKHAGTRIGWLLVIFIVLSTYMMFLRNVAQVGSKELVTLTVYAEWSIFFLIVAMQKRVNRRYIFIPFVMIANEIIASFWGISILHTSPLASIYSPIGFSLIIIVSLGVDWSSSITKSDVDHVFAVLFGLGIIACLYAMIAQNDVMRSALSGRPAGWYYTSFLGHRNQFGGFVYLSIMAALYLWQKDTKNVFYPLCIVVFFMNIVMTDSRNAFFSVVILGGLFFIFRLKIPIKTIIFIVIPVLVVVAVTGLRYSDILTAKLFAHKNGASLESESRFLMWSMMLSKIAEHGAFLSGFGTHSNEKYLLQYFSVGGAHNAFVDTLFTGGIVRLAIYITAHVIVYKNICLHPDEHYKAFMKAAFLSFVFYTSFDNASALFSSTFVSLIANVIFAILPWYRKEI